MAAALFILVALAVFLFAVIYIYTFFSETESLVSGAEDICISRTPDHEHIDLNLTPSSKSPRQSSGRYGLRYSLGLNSETDKRSNRNSASPYCMAPNASTEGDGLNVSFAEDKKHSPITPIVGDKGVSKLFSRALAQDNNKKSERDTPPHRTPPIEFKEVIVSDRDLIVADISPIRYTDVFIIGQCSISSPTAGYCAQIDMECDNSLSSESLQAVRDRQELLRRNIEMKQLQFESALRGSSSTQQQMLQQDRNLLVKATAKISVPEIAAPPSAPVAEGAGLKISMAHEMKTSASSLGFNPSGGGSVKPAETTSRSNVTQPTTSSPTSAIATPSPRVQSAAVQKLSAYTQHQDFVKRLREKIFSHTSHPASEDLQLPGHVVERIDNTIQTIRGLNAKSASECSLEIALEVGATLELILKQARHSQPHCGLSIRKKFIEEIMNSVGSRGCTEDAVLVMSHILSCLCRDSRPGAELAYNSILTRSALCWPSLVAVPLGAGATAALEGHTRFVALFSTLIMSSELSSVFRKEDGWSWLVRMGKQLHSCFKLISESVSSPDDNILVGLRMGCAATFKFIKICGRSMLLEYGSKKLEDIFRGLSNVCSSTLKLQFPSPMALDEVTRLSALLHDIISEGKCGHLYLKSQPPYVLTALAYSSSLNKLRIAAEVLDQDKSPETMSKKDSVGLRTLPLAFNIISAVESSQDKAVDSLVTKINAANELSDREILPYVIYKITLGALGYCQTEHFSLKSPGATPMCRVICRLCEAGGPSISAIFKMQFFSICPFTIPKITEEATGDQYFINMGFNTKRDANNKLLKEDKDKWLGRMEKLLGVFGCLCVQPEQNPFTISDAWSWLSRIVNTCSNMEGSPIEPTAKLLDTFLRATGPEMMDRYGPAYIQLLRNIQEKVIPVLTTQDVLFTASIAKSQLEEFLLDAISSNGSNIQPLS